MIHFYSTNLQSPRVDLGEALLRGQAPDKGLYMPEELPRFSKEFLRRARDLSYPELAVEILAPYAESVFSREALSEICQDAYDFPVPLEQVSGRHYVLRLDRVPRPPSRTSQRASWAGPWAAWCGRRGRSC